MAKVSVSLESQPITREEGGAEFAVKNNANGMVGRLVISKGGVRWWSKNERGDGHFINWRKLDEELKKYPRK